MPIIALTHKSTDHLWFIRLLTVALIAVVLFAQGAEIGIQVNLGVFKPEEHFAFFTTWTSIGAALCAAWIIICPQMSKWQLWLLGNLAVSATIVGGVYWVLVRTPGYWPVSSELLLHAITPVMTVLLFLIFSWQYLEKFSAWMPLSWTIVPLGYAIFVVMTGLISGWFPYDFLDASKHGWPQTGLMMVCIFLGAGLVGYLLSAPVDVRQRIRADDK